MKPVTEDSIVHVSTRMERLVSGCQRRKGREGTGNDANWAQDFFQGDENFLKLDYSGGSATLKKNHFHLNERILQYVHDSQISLLTKKMHLKVDTGDG